MAFERGQLITASKLNSIGKGKTHTVSCDWDYKNETYRTIGHCYIRQSSGYMAKYRFKDYGWVRGPHFEFNLDRYVNGVYKNGKWQGGHWKNEYYKKLGGEEVEDTYWNSRGTGYYRVTAKGRGGGHVKWHWGVRDATKGHYLRYFSGLPWNPTYTRGTLLTTSILNSGKVGTTPNI